MAVSLFQFEAINELHQSLLRMGDFETCADPRGYIRTSNQLLDTCYSVLGVEHVDQFASAEDCAADFIARAMLSADMVEDVA
jgi:hypothetical protein